MRTRRIAWLPALGTAVVFTACDGGTPFDPIALNQAAQEVVAAMENSEASESMGVLGPKMTVGAAAMVAATIPDGELLTGSPQSWTQGMVETLQRAGGGLGVRSPADHIIPQTVFGTTFTYDTQTQQYQPSGDAGAPSNGVRFRLYAVASGAVVEPLQDIGFVELTEGPGSTLGLNVVVGNLLDYEASATLASTSISLSAQGFISDGTTQVDFDLSLEVSGTTGVTVDYAVEVPANDVGIRLQISGNLDLVGTATITINHQGSNVVLKVTGGLESGPVSGTIEHNGDVVVNISGTLASLVFTNATGSPLTTPEVDALKSLAAFIDELFVAFARLLFPAFALLGLELFI